MSDAFSATDLKARDRPEQRLQDSNLYNFAFVNKSTLLHGATKERMIDYCKKLIFYGFDIQMKPFDDEDDCESAWDVSIRNPSKINEYFISILVKFCVVSWTFILCFVVFLL